MELEVLLAGERKCAGQSFLKCAWNMQEMERGEAEK